MSIHREVIGICILAFFHVWSPAQEFAEQGNNMDLIRQYAEDQEYDRAKQFGEQILERDPQNHDVALYLARIYGWDAQYDSAYAIVDRVISENPDLEEAYRVRMDLAYWENDWKRLEEYCLRALELHPGSDEIKEKLALARYRLGLNRDQLELIVSYFYDHFNEPYKRNWHMLTLGASIPVHGSKIIPYLNGGFNSGTTIRGADLQANLDAYLSLGKKNYALVGYGFSPDGPTDFLPVHRAAAEIWQVLPAGFAVSAGTRFFYWEEPFTFLTFSGEKYVGNSWFSLRNYLFFKDYGASASWYASARRYMADRFNYLFLTIGYGTAPDEPLLVLSDLDRLRAVSVRTGFSWQVRHNLRWQLMLGYSHEAYSESEQRSRIDLRTGINISLKR